MTKLKPILLSLSFLLSPWLLGVQLVRADIPNYSFVGFEGVGDLRGNLDKRLGTTLNSVNHYINIEDCRRYAGGEMKVNLRVDPIPNGNWQYAIAYAPPGKTCATTSANPEASQGTCIVPAAQRELTSSNVSATLSLDELMGKDCDANSSGEASIYFILQESTLSQVNFERIIVNVFLRAPRTPELESVSGQDAKLRARWKDDANEAEDTNYVLYWADAPFGEDDLDAVDSRGSISGKSATIDKDVYNDVTYYVSVAARDKADNESALSNQLTAKPQSTTDFWDSYAEAGGDAPGGFCFIATAAYGTPMANELVTFRSFRDQVLLTSSLGALLVETYYSVGRFWAAFIADSPVLRWLVRTALVPFLYLARFILWAGPLGALAYLLLGLSAWQVVKRRKRPKGGFPFAHMGGQ